MFSIIPNGTYANNNLGQMQMPAQNQLIPGTAPMEVEGAVVGRGNGPHGECITCDSRRYVDDSTDSGVSFQVPTHISPEQSFSKVRAHEYEHLRR
ncbi:MAG: hypothetical protein FWB74_02020, partial [Defluviitaleaceae bacterium]|nr:hypothetical protein [Defluviitaleaceae bacterium]